MNIDSDHKAGLIGMSIVLIFILIIGKFIVDAASEIEIHEIDSGTKCAVTGLIVKSISCWEIKQNDNNSKQGENNAATG